MDQKKKSLYVDFDSTIADSESAFCVYYNALYKEHPDFVPADPKALTRWDFKDQCPLIHQEFENPVERVRDMFGEQGFFDNLTTYDHAVDILHELGHRYQVVICTAAWPANASKKVLWIEKHLPFIPEVLVVINKRRNGVGKGRVSMLEEGAIFIDDHPENLHSTKASRKILYKYKDTAFNQGWEGEVVSSWKQVAEKLLP